MDANPTKRRVLLVLDSSSAGNRLIEVAIDLATDLAAPVEALLIEDINLARLAGAYSPNQPLLACQVSHHSQHRSTITGGEIDRELRVHARKIERRLGDLASQASVKYSFRIVQGIIDDEIRAAAATVDLLALWGARRSLITASGHNPPSPILPPLQVINTRPRHRSPTSPPSIWSENRRGLSTVSTEVILLSGQSPAVREDLLIDLMHQPGRRTILVPA